MVERITEIQETRYVNTTKYTEMRRTAKSINKYFARPTLCKNGKTRWVSWSKLIDLVWLLNTLIEDMLALEGQHVEPEVEVEVYPDYPQNFDAANCQFYDPIYFPPLGGQCLRKYSSFHDLYIAANKDMSVHILIYPIYKCLNIKDKFSAINFAILADIISDISTYKDFFGKDTISEEYVAIVKDSLLTDEEYSKILLERTAMGEFKKANVPPASLEEFKSWKKKLGL